MKRNGVVGLIALLVAGFICGAAAAQSLPTAKSSISEATQKSRVLEDYGRLPLSFEINHGQTDPRVKFLSRGVGQTLFLTSNETVLALSKAFDPKPDSLGFPNLSFPHTLRTTLLRMRLLGANPLSDVVGLETLPGTSNYFIGSDPARWHTNVPTYGRVRYSQIYPGIDLVYYGNQQELEYDFVVAPRADPSQIRLAIQGAGKIYIDASGNAVLHRRDGEFRLLKPRFYQEVGQQKIEIAGRYALKGRELRFDVGPYDSQYPLTIDPVLSYSTFLGGSGTDGGQSIAVDGAGNAYVTGSTTSPNFPGISTSSFQSTETGGSVFVTKINPTGSAVLFSTYLGGFGDYGMGIAVDSSENVYVSGITFSGGFPLSANPIQSNFSSPNSGFVTKLNSTGSAILYSTYLRTDRAEAIAVDPAGNAYVTGWIQDLGRFPCCATSYFGSSGTNDVYVAKIDPTGSTLVYSAYVGGTGSQRGWGIAADSSGNAYVTGDTSASNFPVTANSYQTTFGGSLDAFALKLDPTGTSLLYSTYIGGTGSDQNHAIAIDSSGDAYMAGSSAGIAIAMKLDATGHTLLYSTPLSTFYCCDTANGIAVDGSGQAYITGAVGPTLITMNPIQATWAGGTYDSFMSQLDAFGNIIFATFLGGDLDDRGQGIAVDSSGAAYLTGSTQSNSNELIPFPTTLGVIQPANTGGTKIFVTKFAGSSAATTTTTTLTSAFNPSIFGQQASFTVTVSPSSSSSLTPSGNATISDGSTTLATVRLASGTATFATSTLAVGSHSITASYGGDSNFSASTSVPLSQVVNQGTTTTSVSASPNPGIVGQPVTLTATIAVVAPAAGTPGVTVTFLDGSTSLGTGTLSAGQATLTTSALAAGSHSITATYGGDSNFLGSSSYTLTLGIQQLTTTMLVAVPNPANAGQVVTLTATVAGSSGAPTGETVTFLDGATVLGTGTISAGGTATFTTASLVTGNHSLSASYPGDASFAPSTSITVPLSVVLPPAVITDNETITVSDTASFPDVFDSENVKVTDQVTVYAFFPVAISPAPPILSAVLNQPYSGVTFSGTGGYQSLTLSESGAVPGMSFAISGASTTFSGTPTQAGTFPFTITATDSIGNKLNQNYSLMVSASCPAISVSPTGSLGVANAGTAFSQAFTASGGVGTTKWSTASALPLGINFVGGVLSGIPTQSGTFALTITATDQNGCQGSSNVSFVVVPPPAVITDNETITVTDAVSFPDVFDSENIKVTDQVVIQAISPTATSIIAPGVIYGTPAAATVSVSSPYGAVSGNVTLSVDGGAPTTMALSSGSAVFSAGILTPGTHSLVASFPAQGNFLASSATGALFISQPPAFTSANSATFTVGATGTFSVTTTGIPYPSLTIPPGTLPTGVTFTDNLNGTATLAGIPAAGTGGIYALTITANNGVGAPVLQSFTLTVDQASAITSGSSTTFTEGVPGSFTLTSTGFPISALSESPALPAGLNFFDNGDGTAILSGTPAVGTQGSYVITFTAASGVGTNATQNFTLAINLGPAITSGSGTTLTEQMPGSFLVTTMGFPVPSLTETGPLPTGIKFVDNGDGTASLAGTPAVGTSNIYPITITANNGFTTTQTFTLTVNSTAAITSGSTTTFTVGSAGFFSITTMGTPAPSLTFTGALPTGVTFMDNGNGTATLSGTPAAGTANSYPLAITANNGVGTAAVQNFTLVVNQGAAILSGNSTTFTAGVQGTFTVMTSGSPTPTLTETPPLLPAGVTFVDNVDGTATLSGTPAAGAGGTYPITITANNGVDLPAVQTFTLNINQNPAITSSNMVTFNELAMGSFVVTSTGNPLPTLTEVGNLPNGVTFTDNGDGTAFLGGLPAAGSGDQYGFTITAANGVLPSATQTFTLTVVPGLSFTSPSGTSFNAGAQNSFTITTAGTPTPTLTLSGRLPGGIAFTRLGNGTATLSGVPLGGTEGSYLITFTAVNRTGAIATQTFTLIVQPPSVDSAPVITSANHATFAFGLVAGNGGTIPYNFFKVTTTGFPVPKLTARFVAQGIQRGGTVPYFHDNGDGTATISFAPAYYGTDRFVITATGAGGLTTTQSFTLLIQRLFTPMFTSANQVGFTVGVLNSFTVVAGPFVDQITGGGGLPPGVGLTDNHDGTATLSGAPNTASGQTGTYKVTFTASNPNTNTFRKTPYTATQTFTLAVLPSVDSAPVITSANHATFAFGLVAGNGGTIPYNFFKVTTTGFPVPKLTAKFVAQGSRVGGTVSYFHDNGDGTATISFAPAYYGTDRFVITATGAGGLTTTQSFTLLIQRLFTPMFTSANQVGFTVGVLNSFTVVAGPFVDQITGGGGLPPGVGLTDNHDGTATLSGAPNTASGQTGTYKVTFTASNPNTNTFRKTPYTATQTFTLAVLPSVDSAPVITSANHATFAFGLVAGNGGTIPYNFFKVTTTGFPVPKLTAKFVAQGSRVGGTVSYFHDNGDGTATISFAPAYYGTDRFVITATGAGGLTTTQSFTLLIQRLFTPMFTSANQVGFTVGVLNSFTVVAGPFVDQITGGGGLPPGVGLTDNHDGTATLSGAPNTASGQTGTYKVTFTASNPNTNTFRKTPYTATQTFTLAVLP